MNIYNWPAVVAGSKLGGTYSTAGAVGNAAAVAPMLGVSNVNFWRGGFFCAKRLAAPSAGSTATKFVDNAGDPCP